MKLDLRAKIILLSSAAGAVAGVVSAFLGNSWAALGLVLLTLLVVIKKTPDILKFQPSQFRGMEIFKTGGFPLLIMWLIAWIMVYSLFIVH